MSDSINRDINNALNYLESVNLPLPPTLLESTETDIAPVVFDDTKAVAVGSQLTEFGQDVPADFRSTISNCVLLAQLAANKASENVKKPDAWYKKFNEVFNELGWIVRASNFQKQDIGDKNAELHEAIIPVIMGLLAPQAVAASVILSILKGLKAMDKESPWITLFERESHRFEARHFQLGFADMDESNQPKVSLLCFELEASKITTQVLFFKFSDSSAVLRQKATTLGISPSMLLRLKPGLDAKLSSYISSYIKSIEI